MFWVSVIQLITCEETVRVWGIQTSMLIVHFYHLHPTQTILWRTHQDVIVVSCRFEGLQTGFLHRSRKGPVYLQRPCPMCLTQHSAPQLIGRSVRGLLTRSGLTASRLTRGNTTDTVDFNNQTPTWPFCPGCQFSLRSTLGFCRLLFEGLILIFWSSVYKRLSRN